jgi:uncharacterized phage infection (PIP) family protein YhgE
MNKAVILLAAVGLVILVASAGAQRAMTEGGSIEQQVQQLEMQVQNLNQRLSSLEHASGAAPTPMAMAPSTGRPTAAPAGDGSGGGQAGMSGGGGTTAEPASEPVDMHPGMKPDLSGVPSGRYAQVDNIQAGQADTSTGAQQQQLEQEIAALQKTYDSSLVKLAGEIPNPSGGTQYARDAPSSAETFSGLDPQRLADQRTSDFYRAQIDRKKKQLGRLQRANNSVQVIHGHEGKVVITLKTDHDMSSVLNNINVGDYITWTGTRMSMDPTSETWMVKSVRKLNTISDQ